MTTSIDQTPLLLDQAAVSTPGEFQPVNISLRAATAARTLSPCPIAPDSSTAFRPTRP
jgi:hypothetical protein